MFLLFIGKSFWDYDLPGDKSIKYLPSNYYRWTLLGWVEHGTVKKKSNRISITFFWLELISWHEPCFKPAMSSLFKKIYCPFSNIWPINNQFPKSSFLVGQKWLIFLHTYLVLLFCIYRYIFEFLVLNNRGYKTEEPKHMSDYNDVSFLQKFENLN